MQNTGVGKEIQIHWFFTVVNWETSPQHSAVLLLTEESLYTAESWPALGLWTRECGRSDTAQGLKPLRLGTLGPPWSGEARNEMSCGKETTCGESPRQPRCRRHLHWDPGNESGVTGEEPRRPNASMWEAPTRAVPELQPLSGERQ